MNLPMKRLVPVRRKSIDISAERSVLAEPLAGEKTLPLVMKPLVAGADLLSWASDNQELINTTLLEHGGILLRGFQLNSVTGLERLITTLSGELLNYHDRATPRHSVGDRIYTSTEYPADQTIELHNECSYAHSWPMRIFFYCATPAEKGGETPIADCRRVYRRIAPDIRDRFREKGIMYVRNFGFGLGPSWREVFGADDKATVEGYFHNNDIDYEWGEADRLTIRQVRPAIASHPVTGETVWFNQAAPFHVSTLDAMTREVLLAEMDERKLPKNSYYGDGSRIDDSTLIAIREAYRQETITFRWERGDLLMLDNMMAAHGRAPFAGNRKVLVGMAGPVSWQDV